MTDSPPSTDADADADANANPDRSTTDAAPADAATTTAPTGRVVLSGHERRLVRRLTRRPGVPGAAAAVRRKVAGSRPTALTREEAHWLAGALRSFVAEARSVRSLGVALAVLTRVRRLLGDGDAGGGAPAPAIAPDPGVDPGPDPRG